MLRILLFPVLVVLAVLYAAVMFLRNCLFDFNLRKPNRVLDAKVICVGNLTAGGTGKTPVVALLVQELIKKGFATGIVSRGYGGTYEKSLAKSSVQVDPKIENAARVFGDEPTWLCEELKTQVWVGRDKFSTALSMLRDSQDKVNVVLADDAFQHRQLARDLDILIIDATAKCHEYLPLPLARGREDFILGLRRADIIVLNKINLVSQARLQNIERLLMFLKSKKTLLVSVSNRIEEFSFLGSTQKLQAKALKGEAIFLVSAIAKPAQFTELVLQNTGAKLVGEKLFSDHSNFEIQSLQLVEKVALEKKAKYIVVTEKDAVKLKGVELKVPILVSSLKLSAPELLDAVVSRLSR